MNEARMENCNCTTLKRPENRRDGYTHRRFLLSLSPPPPSPPTEQKVEKKLFSKFSHFPVLPFASKLYLWQGIYAPHAYVTQEISPEGKRNCTRTLLPPFSSPLSCMYFLFVFTLSFVRTLSVNNDSCCSVTLSRISRLNFPLPRQTCREEFWAA